MQVTQDFVQRIKNSITLSEFLQKYVNTIPAGHNRYKALCPFHNEKTPSFVINDDRQLYHCFGCNAHGDVISFLTDKEGYSFVDAVKYLADYAGIQIPKEFFEKKERVSEKEDYQILVEINAFFKEELLKSPGIIKYLTNRKVSKKLIEKFEIGYAPDAKVMDAFVAAQKYDINKLVELGIYKLSENKRSYFLFHNRIIFPIQNHFGQIVAFGGRITGQGMPKYLNSPEHKFFKKREILFNLFNAKSGIKKHKTAIICEGYMDVIALEGSGFNNAVAPLGTAFSEMHMQALWKYTDKPVMCLDGDDAGRRAMVRAAHIVVPKLKPGKTLLFAILPSGKDPDDILKEEGGKEKLEKILTEDAVSLGEILVDEISTTRPSKLPEERAKILQELNNIADKISDKLVKKQYLQYFNQACFNLFRQKKYKFSQTQNNLSLKESSVSRKELDLILFICFNIHELEKDNIEEEFSLIEFGHEELIKLQMYLLSVSEEFKIDEFKKWVKENIVQLKKPILKAVEDLEEIQKTTKWDILYKSYYLEKLQNDYKVFCESGDPDEYQKAIEILGDIKKLQAEFAKISLESND